MGVHALDGQGFGFAVGCFVCDPNNERGLRLSLFHDDEAQVVFADFTLGTEYSGAPRFVHGGILVTLMDEMMAWAAIAVGHRFTVARASEVTYRKPVKVDEPHRVEGRLVALDGKEVETSAHVLDAKGRTCATAAGHFVVLSERMARAAIGADLADNLDYLR